MWAVLAVGHTSPCRCARSVCEQGVGRVWVCLCPCGVRSQEQAWKQNVSNVFSAFPGQPERAVYFKTVSTARAPSSLHTHRPSGASFCRAVLAAACRATAVALLQRLPGVHPRPEPSLARSATHPQCRLSSLQLPCVRPAPPTAPLPPGGCGHGPAPRARDSHAPVPVGRTVRGAGFFRLLEPGAFVELGWRASGRRRARVRAPPRLCMCPPGRVRTRLRGAAGCGLSRFGVC